MTIFPSVIQCFGPTLVHHIFLGGNSHPERSDVWPPDLDKQTVEASWRATYSVLGVEDVGGRRVVDDDDFAELPAQSAEVFDVVSPVENAGFPEEPGAEHPPLVQQVGHRVGILRGENKNIRTGVRHLSCGGRAEVTNLCQAGREEDTLEELPHLLEELVHVRPLQHVHLGEGAELSRAFLLSPSSTRLSVTARLQSLQRLLAGLLPSPEASNPAQAQADAKSLSWIT